MPPKDARDHLQTPQMFVRLFVDENLDRHVPISKQPKEKIQASLTFIITIFCFIILLFVINIAQAIIDSCARQFPEFSERARKRIRTYLKSCRRTKRYLDFFSSFFLFSFITFSF